MPGFDFEISRRAGALRTMGTGAARPAASPPMAECATSVPPKADLAPEAPLGRPTRVAPVLPNGSASAALQGLTFHAGQLEAVTHGEGPLLILAGPGTGKTFTLAARMAYLVEQGQARPHEILAITFARKAAEDIRRRLIELVGVTRAGALNVWTIHKLCRRIVRAHATEVGRSRDFEVFNRPRSKWLIGSIIGNHACEEVRAELAGSSEVPSDELVKELIEQISLAKNALWSIEDYLQQSTDRRRTLAAAVWRELEHRLRAANAFDFDDLLVHAAGLLSRNERLRAHYRERYRWLLIDEFQDVNRAQMALVRLLMPPGGNLTVVGDVDQCLYGFRLAGPENILNFTSDFPEAATVTLSLNRRNRPNILRAALRVIAHNKLRVPKPLVAMQEEDGFLDAWGYPTDKHEAADITRLISTELSVGRDPREILVLCSQHRPLEYLQRRLEDSGIRVRLLGGRSLWELAPVRDAIAYVQLLANPFNAQAFRRVLSAPSDQQPFTQGRVTPPRLCSDGDVARIIEFAERHEPDLINAMLRVEEIDGISARARAPLHELARALDRIRRRAWSQATGPPLTSLINAALNIHGGPVSTYEYLHDHAASQMVRGDAARVLEDLVSLRRAAERYEEVPGGLPLTLTGFVESLEEPDEHELALGQDDRVTLATGHAGKGGEAETVIVIAVEEGVLPDWRSPIEEQRRLFYVATTRAKDNLLFTWVASRDGRRTDGPSRFLAEADLI